MYMNNTENIPININIDIRHNGVYTIICCWLVDTFSFLDLLNHFDCPLPPKTFLNSNKGLDYHFFPKNKIIILSLEFYHIVHCYQHHVSSKEKYADIMEDPKITLRCKRRLEKHRLNTPQSKSGVSKTPFACCKSHCWQKLAYGNAATSTSSMFISKSQVLLWKINFWKMQLLNTVKRMSISLGDTCTCKIITLVLSTANASL